MQTRKMGDMHMAMAQMWARTSVRVLVWFPCVAHLCPFLFACIAGSLVECWIEMSVKKVHCSTVAYNDLSLIISTLKSSSVGVDVPEDFHRLLRDHLLVAGLISTARDYLTLVVAHITLTAF